MLTKRSKEKELLDLGPKYYTSTEYRQCLKTLFKVNQLLGFFKHTVNLLKRFPKANLLVDIGCGGGLFLLNLQRYYPELQMIGMDISEEAIQVAQNELAHWKQQIPQSKIDFQHQTEAELNLAKSSVDVILVTLVCHHLEDNELIHFLKKANEVARQAIIINDLHRHPVAYWLYRLVAPLLFRNRLITHDGLISIQRSFTRKELKYFLQEANIKHYRISWHFPFRWIVLIMKNQEDNVL